MGSYFKNLSAVLCLILSGTTAALGFDAATGGTATDFVSGPAPSGFTPLMPPAKRIKPQPKRWLGDMNHDHSFLIMRMNWPRSGDDGAPRYTLTRGASSCST